MATQNRKGGLFINALAFRFEVKPRDFYFATQSIKVTPSYKLKKKTCPVELCETYPELSPCDQVYTTYDVPAQGFRPIKVNLSNPDNYYFAKQYYKGRLDSYLRQCNLLVKPNAITKECEAWQFDNKDNKNSKYSVFDRYTVKIDYDHFNHHPQLVLSYDRPAKVYNTSVQQIFDSYDDPFSDKQPSDALFNWVLYKNGEDTVIDRYSFLSEQDDFDANKAYPVLWRKLISFLELDIDDETKSNRSSKQENKYKRYYMKIEGFYKQYLDNEVFRSIIDISRNGFSLVNPKQVGQVASKSSQLLFGNNRTNENPQLGVNNGPFKTTPYQSIKLLAIFPKLDRKNAHNLLLYFKPKTKGGIEGEDYYKGFDGLMKYVGKPISFADIYMEIQDNDKIIEELDDFLARNNDKFVPDNACKYVAIYLTPISKHTSNRSAKAVYYQVKQKLLKYSIESQCIETNTMLKFIEEDKKRNIMNFRYVLQNMALAITAKLRGTPWRLVTSKQNELIVGVGAFQNQETDTMYIGSAFSFNNTGEFNSFEFFQKDELKELAGSIEEAIVNFTNVNDKPERLIIHYYKTINKHEIAEIENVLHRLDVDIPVYVVTIRKTESEDYVLFEPISSDYEGLMPYSGTYVNLGNSSYLLCNNTRYENCVFNPRDGYPFPVKIKIECPTNGGQPIDTQVVAELIEQVYQFSRIYWKSVKQQHLPVTIKYPEMLAEIVSHFQGGMMPSQQNNLWFL